MARSSGTCQIVIVVLALFLTGSANTILTKVLLTVRGVGENGKMETFQKPFFGTQNMFTAMAFIILLHWCKQLGSRRTVVRPDLSDQLVPQTESKPPLSTTKALMLIAPPALFDLLSMALMLVGMLFIPASVWQMLRGANIVFAAILTVVILRRRLYAFHWVGVGLAILGILAVSIAALQAGSKNSSDTTGSDQSHVALGVGIVIFAQVIQATQIILEEQLLNDLNMDPLLIVGAEGLWGLLFMGAVMPVLYVLPGSDHGHAEDSVDTWHFLVNSAEARAVVFAYMVSVATYNVAGMMVTSALSGVMRVMLEATRTLCIWLFTLAWHYFVDPSSAFGEEWTDWSYLQAFGFMVLIVGQGTYGQKIVWRCLYYPPPDPVEEAHFASPGAVRAGTFASPSTGVVRTGAFASPHSPAGGSKERSGTQGSCMSMEDLEHYPTIPT